MMDRVEPEIRGLSHSFGFMATTLCISILGPFAMYIVQTAGNERGYLILSIISSIASMIAAIYFILAFGQRKKHEPKILENSTA